MLRPARTANPEDERGRGEGQPKEDQEFHLAQAAQDEAKRIATHPVQEAHRLQEETREGSNASGLFLLLGEVGLGVWVLAALLMVAVFLIAYFVAG
jgi:hypothetical protein